MRNLFTSQKSVMCFITLTCLSTILFTIAPRLYWKYNAPFTAVPFLCEHLNCCPWYRCQISWMFPDTLSGQRRNSCIQSRTLYRAGGKFHHKETGCRRLNIELLWQDDRFVIGGTYIQIIVLYSNSLPCLVNVDPLFVSLHIHMMFSHHTVQFRWVECRRLKYYAYFVDKYMSNSKKQTLMSDVFSRSEIAFL